MRAGLKPSVADIEAQLAAAREWLADGPTDYQRQRYGAVIEALTWVQRGGVGPISGDDYGTITAKALFHESNAAQAAEQAALQFGGDSVRPGCVFESLQWILGHGDEPVD